MHDSFDTLLASERVGYSLPDGRVLLQDLTLGFGRERTGLVGPNGIGKTSLARILAGELTPATGRVVRSGRVGYLPQQRKPITSVRATAVVADALGIATVLETLERVLAGSGDPADLDAVEGQWDLPDRIAALLDRLGLEHLPLERPLEGVSGGEATRVALARLLLDHPDFLILDEPTNHLDLDSLRAVEHAVGAYDGALVVVSHDEPFLEAVGVERRVALAPRGPSP